MPIVFIDEIHNIVGAGAMGSGSMDASNMLRPYLEEGTIRFIGVTTYDEYKKYFRKEYYSCETFPEYRCEGA